MPHFNFRRTERRSMTVANPDRPIEKESTELTRLAGRSRCKSMSDAIAADRS